MHAELLSGRVPNARLAGVFDAVPEAAQAVAEKLRVPAAPDAQTLLGLDAVDAVAICTSPETHVNLTGAAADAGKKRLFAKPLPQDLVEFDLSLDAVQGAGVYLQVGFNRRFDPAHASVRDAVASGALGDVHLVRISSRDPAPPPLAYARTSGGLFLDMTIHDF